MQPFIRSPEPYHRPRLGRKFLGGLTVLFLGSFVLICLSLARGPDRDLELVQEVQIPQSTTSSTESTAEDSINTFQEAISNVHHWPKWHHLVTRAETDQGISEIGPGSRVQLTIQTKNRKEASTLIMEVVAYEPKRLLQLKLLQDSQNELTRLFDRVDWTVERIPGTATKNAVLRGRLHVHTTDWRSRLFGGLSRTTRDGMLRAIFYVNVQALAQFKPASDPEQQKVAVLRPPVPDEPALQRAESGTSL